MSMDLRRMRFLMDSLPDNYKQKKLEIWSAATKITGGFDVMPRGNEIHSKVEDGAERLAELDEAYADAIAELEAMIAEVKPIIKAMVEDRYINVKAAMWMRYIQGIKPQDIADSLQYDIRYVFKLLAEGERWCEKFSKLDSK